jgi:hypothetical protein
MPSRVYRINGHHVTDFSSFVDEVNKAYIRHLDGSPSWLGNLDALNDYASWPEDPFEVVFDHSDSIKSALGYPATLSWLEGLLETCHSTNRASVLERISWAERGLGETLYDQILQIFRGHANLKFKQN